MLYINSIYKYIEKERLEEDKKMNIEISKNSINDIIEYNLIYKISIIENYLHYSYTTI